MIWALVERGKRHAAEIGARIAREEERGARLIADHNRNVAAGLADRLKAADDQLALVRGRLNETRIRLAQCGDPLAIKAWLDQELREETL
jgi:small-conductance mechanosensitive channel